MGPRLRARPARSGPQPHRVSETESAEEQVEILSKTSVRWDLLADAARRPLGWKAITRQMGPQALRMNLNTLVRHGVFENDERTVDEVARWIAGVEEIKRSRRCPYQFVAAYLNASRDLSHKIKAALHTAADVACGNVPRLSGPIVIGLAGCGISLPPQNAAIGAPHKPRLWGVAQVEKGHGWLFPRSARYLGVDATAGHGPPLKEPPITYAMQRRFRGESLAPSLDHPVFTETTQKAFSHFQHRLGTIKCGELLRFYKSVERSSAQRSP
jgi:hypothetical protein